jgi:hypothetical protein
MNSENRVIKASFMTGMSDIALGLIMMLTGWQQWYYDHFHFFGIVGISMLLYSYWHTYYVFKETKESPWKRIK